MTWKNDLIALKESKKNLVGFVGKFSKETQLAFLKRCETAGKLPDDLASAVRRTTELASPMFAGATYEAEAVFNELRDLLGDMPLVRSVVQVFSTEGSWFNDIRPFVAVETQNENEAPGASLNDEPVNAGREIEFKFIDGNDSFTIRARNKDSYVDQVTSAILGNRSAGRATPSWSNGLEEASIRVFASAKWEEELARDTSTASSPESTTRSSYESTSKKTTFGA
jgi:hypothetical protein